MLNTMRHNLDQASPLTTRPNEALTILLMSGAEDGGKRATLAFVAAVSAVAMERPTQVFLAGDGVLWADPDEAREVHVHGFPPLSELVQEYLDLGGRLLACSTCERFCVSREPSVAPNRWSAMEVRGMAAMLDSQAGGHSLSF